ncbi:MAG: hypothetical protein KAR09_11075, partial [Bacteroidales bacterium]|nr:hypothetical protein [Bacteroidales bacterium]
YHVSTLYDLSAYGFPGDTGESLYTGPEEVCLVYGTMLPIVEEWSSGSFGSFWTAEDHWVINGQYGNPLPCAEFKWDPVLMDYQQCLTSGPINGVDHGTKSEPYIDGQFILNFDISLVDNSVGGTEYFNVEVWSDGVWNRVEQLSNANGNFDWENIEVDITEYALGYVFKVRFMAEGEASYHILSWFLDNIEVYHYCASPENLYYHVNGPNICELYWSPPVEPMKQSVFQSLLKSEKLKKSLIGYNLFWMYDINPYSLLDHTVDTFYTYYLPEEGNYFFYVTAVFESCESGASNEIWVPFPPPSGINENSKNNIIQVFPNPASDMINLESSVRMSRLCLLDYSGRSLQCHELQNQIQTS